MRFERGKKVEEGLRMDFFPSCTTGRYPDHCDEHRSLFFFVFNIMCGVNTFLNFLFFFVLFSLVLSGLEQFHSLRYQSLVNDGDRVRGRKERMI